MRAGPMKTWGPLCTQGIWGGNEEEEHARGDLGGVQEVEVTHLSGRRVKVDPLRARRREATAPGSGHIRTGGNQAFEAEISTSTRTTVGGFRSGGLAGSAGAATEWLRAPRRAGQPTTTTTYTLRTHMVGSMLVERDRSMSASRPFISRCQKDAERTREFLANEKLTRANEPCTLAEQMRLQGDGGGLPTPPEGVWHGTFC